MLQIQRNFASILTGMPLSLILTYKDNDFL